MKSYLNPSIHYVYKPRREFKLLQKIPYIHRFYNTKKAKWEHRTSAKSLYRYYVGKKNFDIEVGFYRGPAIKIISGSTNSHSKKFAWVHTDFKLCNPSLLYLFITTLSLYTSNKVIVSVESAPSFTAL